MAITLPRGRSRHALLVLLVALATLLAVLTPPTDASAAPCVAAVPMNQISAGMAGSGLTVTRGTTPDPFDAEVLGVLADGIAPGVDMILVDVDMPAVQEAGIWAGMSGSPVYADDGRLIGAVSYGLSYGPSSIAGLTPGVDMLDLYDYPGGLGTQRAEVSLPAGLRSRAAAATDATPAQLREGMAALPTPLGVSLPASRIDELEQRLARRANFKRSSLRLYSANRVAPAPGDVGEIVPGGNFVAALSYGDLTAAGVGTTTDVCNGTALAFGHPFAYLGRTRLSAHTADAIVIQPDPAYVSFKVANIGGVVGTVDQDRTVGVRAALGTGPDPIVVRSRIDSTSTDRGRTGRTWINRSTDVADLAPFHVLANMDRVLDKIGEGRTQLTWTATGSTRGGDTWKLTRRNRFASRYDASFESIFEMLDWLYAINGNRFTKATFARVQVTSTVNETFERLRLGTVRVAVNGGAYRNIAALSRLRVRAGDTIRVRVPLKRYQHQNVSRTVNLRLTVPGRLAGRSIRLGVFGGSSIAYETNVYGATSFGNLLTRMRRTESNNDVVARLQRSGGNAGPAVFRKSERSLGNIVAGKRTVRVVVR